MRFVSWLRARWISLERAFLLHATRLFRVKAGAERVARGFAVGMAVNFYPTFGAGVVLSIILARLCGGNPIGGFVGGACLTLLWPAVFYLNLKVGGHLTGGSTSQLSPDLEAPEMNQMLWDQIHSFMVGAIVNTVVFGLLAYGLVWWVMTRHRVRGLKNLMEMLRRRRLRKAPEAGRG